jgi:hypothetical protein
MTYVLQGTEALARETERNQDKLLAYPKRGVHINGGIHGPMPDTWDGVGPVPPGWTSYLGSSVKHPTLPTWSTPIETDATAAMANGRRSRLNALEQSKMSADLAAAVPTLPSDWFPAGAQATKADDGGRT